MGITRYAIVSVVVVASLALTTGCSDKQEQAENLEQEMLGEDRALDTTADTMQMEASVPAVEAEVDAGAVPQEETESGITLPEAPAGNGYTLQVAGCEDRAYAEYLVDLYTGRGYQPFVEQATIGSQLYYRIRLGNFESFESAQALQREIKNRFSVDGWIDRIGS